MDNQPWGSDGYRRPDPQQDPWGNRQNDNRNFGSGRPPQASPGNSLALTSLVFGMLSLVLCLFLVPSILLGPISILFAHLSKGKEKRPVRPARIGAILGGVGFCISAAMLVFSFVWMTSMYGGVGKMRDTMRQRMEQYSEYEDEDPEELYQRIYDDFYRDFYGDEEPQPQQSGADTGEQAV